MRHASLVEAKANLSAFVDEAEHRRKTTVILRHGKPVAILAPVPATARNRVMTTTEIDALFRACDEGQGDPGFDAVADMIAGRR